MRMRLVHFSVYDKERCYSSTVILLSYPSSDYQLASSMLCIYRVSRCLSTKFHESMNL